MLEDDIRSLVGRATTMPLDGLESDIWKDIEAQARQSRAANTVAAWQTAVVALVLVTAVASGTFAARAQITAATTRDAISPGVELAPSTLLLGTHL